MFFFDKPVERCGFYECKKCNYRFLTIETDERTFCPMCSQNVNYEIGPDESLEDILECAYLIDVIDGEDNVKRMDSLLAGTYEDDESWI